MPKLDPLYMCYGCAIGVPVGLPTEGVGAISYSSTCFGTFFLLLGYLVQPYYKGLYLNGTYALFS